MKKQSVIDMLRCGPVLDVSRDGYADFEDNLGKVLYDLHTKYVKVLEKRTKVLVYVSTFSYAKGVDEPTRVSKEKIYTLGYLLRLWGKAFNVAEYEQKCDIGHAGSYRQDRFG